MQERRQGDLMIMDKLSLMHTELALNTRETTRLAEYQKTTNGKVAAHESRLQAIESNQALISNNLATINQTKKDWLDWLLKGLVVLGLLLAYYLLTHNGFPDFLN